MRPLDTNFNHDGHCLRQIWRDSDIAIFERSLSPEHPPHELELIVIKVVSAKTIPSGAFIPEREAYPSSSQWGTYGWSFPTRVKDFVFRLALLLVTIEKGRPSLVRDEISRFKLTAEFLELEKSFLSIGRMIRM